MLNDMRPKAPLLVSLILSMTLTAALAAACGGSDPAPGEASEQDIESDSSAADSGDGTVGASRSSSASQNSNDADDGPAGTPGFADDTVSVASDELPDIPGGGEGPSTPDGPTPSADTLLPVAVTDVQFQVLESWPMQVIVEVSGDLPSPCHELWWQVADDDPAYEISVWSVEPSADASCEGGAAEPFTENVPLGGGFEDREYTFVVNGTEYMLDLS